mgnify:CR=1 FL=1
MKHKFREKIDIFEKRKREHGLHDHPELPKFLKVYGKKDAALKELDEAKNELKKAKSLLHENLLPEKATSCARPKNENINTFLLSSDATLNPTNLFQCTLTNKMIHILRDLLLITQTFVSLAYQICDQIQVPKNDYKVGVVEYQPVEFHMNISAQEYMMKNRVYQKKQSSFYKFRYLNNCHIFYSYWYYYDQNFR